MTDRSTSGCAQMGTSMAAVNNVSGRHDEPRAATQYAATPTASPKVPPSLRLRAARQINANSGARLDTDMTKRLQAIAAGNPLDPETYPRFKRKAHADAVDAACDAAGYQDGGAFDVRLGRPSEDVLRHVFGLGRQPRSLRTRLRH